MAILRFLNSHKVEINSWKGYLFILLADRGEEGESHSGCRGWGLFDRGVYKKNHIFFLIEGGGRLVD